MGPQPSPLVYMFVTKSECVYYKKVNNDSHHLCCH